MLSATGEKKTRGALWPVRHQREVFEFIPKSGTDLLARALPYMAFTTVVNNVIIEKGTLKTPLSSHELPYEDHYNDAFATVFSTMGYTVTRPLNTEGKVDLIVAFVDENSQKTCAIESIMAHRDTNTLVRLSQHEIVFYLLTLFVFSRPFFFILGRQANHNEHARRFSNGGTPKYSSANFKLLITIGSDKDLVGNHVTGIVHVEGLEIVGLVVSQAHDSYQMFVRQSGDQNVLGPFFLPCDRVAKTIEITDFARFTSAQRTKKRDAIC